MGSVERARRLGQAGFKGDSRNQMILKIFFFTSLTIPLPVVQQDMAPLGFKEIRVIETYQAPIKDRTKIMYELNSCKSSKVTCIYVMGGLMKEGFSLPTGMALIGRNHAVAFCPENSPYFSVDYCRAVLKQEIGHTKGAKNDNGTCNAMDDYLLNCPNPGDAQYSEKSLRQIRKFKKKG